MQRTFLTVGGIFILGLILLVVNGLSRVLFSSAYVDLTQERLYSLSQGTKNIIGSLKDPITLNYYFSKTEASRIPAINLFGRRVSDLLGEYERVGKGKIILKTYDPRPDSEEEEWAQKYGLTPIPLRTGERVFFGLAGRSSSGAELAIPVFDTALNVSQQQFLEYQISKLVSALSVDKKPIIGVLSSLDLRGAAANPYQQQGPQQWFFLQQLTERADVRFIEATANQIENVVDVLMVVHPKQLSDSTLYAIDQFVMRGGKLLLLEDPFCEADRPKQDENNPGALPNEDRSSNLNRLTKSWGVEMEEKRVIGDRRLATPVNTGDNSAKNFILWLQLQRANVASDDVVTSALENVILPWAGSLKLSPVEGVTQAVLLKTTTEAMLLKEDTSLYTRDPDQLMRSYVSGGSELTLGVRLRGKLKSAFPEGKPKAAEEPSGEEKAMSSVNAEHLAQSKGESNVLIISDVDFIGDRYSIAVQSVLGSRFVSRLNDNLGLIENSVENLSGSNDLIGVRSRGQFTRDFGLVKNLESQAQERWRNEELLLQAQLEGANQKINQLQSAAQGADKGQSQVLNKAVVDEIKKYRDDRQKAQRRLREVRRNLREDIEALGNRLFLLNTFLVPLVLILLSVAYFNLRTKKR